MFLLCVWVMVEFSERHRGRTITHARYWCLVMFCDVIIRSSYANVTFRVGVTTYICWKARFSSGQTHSACGPQVDDHCFRVFLCKIPTKCWWNYYYTSTTKCCGISCTFICIFIHRSSQIRMLIICLPQPKDWESVQHHIRLLRAVTPATGQHKEKVNCVYNVICITLWGYWSILWYGSLLRCNPILKY